MKKRYKILHFFVTMTTTVLRGSLGAGLTQNTSSVAADQAPKRFAYEVSLEYNFRFRSEYELGVGLRFDRDIYRLSNPTLDIPTTRILAIASATYHFFRHGHLIKIIFMFLLLLELELQQPSSIRQPIQVMPRFSPSKTGIHHAFFKNIGIYN